MYIQVTSTCAPWILIEGDTMPHLLLYASRKGRPQIPDDYSRVEKYTLLLPLDQIISKNFVC